MPLAVAATSPSTTKTKPTSINRTRIDRKAAPVTTALAMLVVILVTLAVGQMADKLLKAPRTASMMMLKIPAINSPRPEVMMSASPANLKACVPKRATVMVKTRMNARSLLNSFLFIARWPQPGLTFWSVGELKKLIPPPDFQWSHWNRPSFNMTRMMKSSESDTHTITVERKRSTYYHRQFSTRKS